MESSVSALRTSLNTYARKLEVFEQAVNKGKIVSVKDLDLLETMFGDDESESYDELLEESILDELTPKSYELNTLLEDIAREKELVRLLEQQLLLIDSEDSKQLYLSRDLINIIGFILEYQWMLKFLNLLSIR